ncbi:type II toxin-antitoxin system HicA family toxin [Pyxidicoccus caerfyrddinensis]|uniref:type II toxin-antitoxin system HicA family toxin n=1 Tax=Pyxidicoccus caerfyrddinensis TaxID=2709663 RepID=UPI0013DA5C5A|nr:type II toxin-antitoxin system HicA family toxin [Pyxidicoccus caerfyrddinensis]
MASRKRKDVETALQRKGFVQTDGDHHYYAYHELGSNKKTAIFTKTSHSGSDLDDFLLARMAKQCRLNKRDFMSLIDCPLDQESYERKVLPPKSSP